MGIRGFLKQSLSNLAHAANSTTSEEWSHLWSIGIYTGPSPLALAPVPGLEQPVLTRDDVTDVCAVMVADPFMIYVAGTWYMFFELYNRRSHGEIGCATSPDGFTWTYQRVVLAEPYHLSYPYVFEWQGEYYMVPESVRAHEVRLYRARRFPDQWDCIGTVLRGHGYADCSFLRDDDRWWMWAESSQGRSDTLRLFSATDLLGPWEEHPRSPIIEWNPHIARPAGRMVRVDGRPVRFAQKCFPDYGTEVRAFEITELSRTTYAERPLGQGSILGPGGTGWNQHGMHHVDAHRLDNGQWIASVDGWRKVASLLDNIHPSKMWLGKQSKEPQ
ncbi:MAG: hypothetical protein Q7U39_14615 [Nitrospira sp.]|nr:hypothetical protein [Nitrospira sp.]